MGRHGKGSRNENVQAPVDWAIQEGAFLCNTAFQHPGRHWTTWTGWTKTTQGETKQPVYNQIDYVLSQMRLKSLWSDSRSYGAVETNSDHKIVVTKIDLKGMFGIRSKKPQPVRRIDVTKLPLDAGLQGKLKETVVIKLHNQGTIGTAKDQMNHLVKCLKGAAAETAGFVQTTRKGHRYDPEIETLSKQQKDLRLQINETKDPTKAKELKKQRNKGFHNIWRRTMNVVVEKLGSQATEVEQMENSAKMFCAARLMRRKLLPKLIVHDENGQTIANPVSCANRVSQRFIGGSKIPLAMPHPRAEHVYSLQYFLQRKAAASDFYNFPS